MIELIKYTEPKKWNKIIRSYKKNDTYYTCEYATSLKDVENGIPYLLNYETSNFHLSYPIFENDLSDCPLFQGEIEKNLIYDWNTPYGYGGPLCDIDSLTLEQQLRFKEELFALAKERNVVSQFIRFHPLLQNQKVCKDVIVNKYLKDTVFIDLTTSDDLMLQMESKNRNLIRKALKNNINIIHDEGKYLNDFIRIYKITMDRDNASEFYYFPRNYYIYLQKNMKGQVEYFYAIKDGQIAAASIFFYNKNFIHYHLSANLIEYRQFAPTNLLLYEAANWARNKGIKYFHLGGGVDSEDSLFHFKKQFNKNGRIPFYIGGNIFDYEKYNALLKKRLELDPAFDINNSYFIQYRKN